MYYRPGAQEEQALEDRVVDRVEDGGGQGEGREFRRALRVQQQRAADADQDDADVLDAVEGKQPLDVVLHDRVKHAHHGRDRADGQDQQGQPVGAAADDIDRQPDQAVDPGLDHRPGHDGRNVRRRHRVGARQPGVERHRAGLGREPDRDENQDQVPRHRGQCGRGKVPGGEVDAPAAPRGEKSKADQDGGRGHVGHSQVQVAGRDDIAGRPEADDQEGGEQGHRLPRQQECESVTRAQDKEDAAQEERERRALRPAARLLADHRERSRGRRETERNEERAAQAVVVDGDRCETERMPAAPGDRSAGEKQPAAQTEGQQCRGGRKSRRCLTQARHDRRDGCG